MVRSCAARILLAAAFSSSWSGNHIRAAEPSQPLKKDLPLPGELFLVDGRPAFVIPAKPRTETERPPWVWYAPTLPGLPGKEERWMFERFCAAGIAIAGIDVGESYGSPAGREMYAAFYRELADRRGMSRKPVLLARSRGGLMLYSWACDNPEKVGGIAGIYPVCNIASYPGVEKAAAAYELTAAELKTALSRHNPIDRLEPLAKAQVPLFAIHGDIDVVVPVELNSGLVAKRYADISGKMELVVPEGQGHNMWAGFFECRELIVFVLRNAHSDGK